VTHALAAAHRGSLIALQHLVSDCFLTAHATGDGVTLWDAAGAAAAETDGMTEAGAFDRTLWQLRPCAARALKDPDWQNTETDGQRAAAPVKSTRFVLFQPARRMFLHIQPTGELSLSAEATPFGASRLLLLCNMFGAL
jgi:hypothetical protein